MEILRGKVSNGNKKSGSQISLTNRKHWEPRCRNKYNSVQFSCSVMSDSLRPHGLQHARLPCPSPTPGACSNSCPRVRDAIQPSHSLLSLSPPAFNLSQHQGLFQWVNYSHQVAQVLEFSASGSVLPMDIQDFKIDWFDMLSVQETLKSLLQHHSSEASILQHSAFFMV